MSSWTCPYCNQMSTKFSYTDYIINSTITNVNIRDLEHLDNVEIGLITRHCPNPKCLKITVGYYLDRLDFFGGRIDTGDQGVIDTIRLRPSSEMKVFPDYVPSSIIDDYKESCLICELSPKSSATLARRCLQGMIRDVWDVKNNNLSKAIEAIKDKVEDSMWKAIDSVRKVGNIGAHMESDINVIVDVEPKEAKMLINLIEILIQEWYVERHERDKRIAAIVDMSEQKQELRKKK
ncbi:DUF4145 domain-containing protein [Proteus faecis]|uniref:DUF4145 domain-containing protein n=1 Tax=Proteus faecis TaxID=2050967 RepID=UPI000D68C631|nr:DUF4145 domain-containing protein [Proteus faecis]